MPRLSRPLALAFCAASVTASGAPGRECGTHVAGASNAAALHRFLEAARGPRASAAPTDDRDVGDVAVVEDRGDLIARRNPVDLAGAALRLRPNASGGYDAEPSDAGYAPGSLPLVFDADESAAVELPFAFPFFGSRYTRVFVHADGSLAFGSAEPDGADHSLGRLLAGPPRIAAWFTDFTTGAGGSVTTRTGGGAVAVSFTEIARAGSAERNSFTVVLHESGVIDLAYARLETADAIVGVAPGGGAPATSADFSAAARSTAGEALVERFSNSDVLDVLATVRRFLEGHPDVFEQVVVYTTRPLNPQPETLAFEVNVRNEVAGIGLEVQDESRAWGSAGALASVVYMDTVDAYRDVDGFEILGHEVGHRWLARLRVPAAAGAGSDVLLGRGGVHWSFFLDSDASVLEGNEIAPAGRSLFETTDIVRGYSPLDLYAMGLATAAEVPPFFYVAEADDFQPARTFTAGSSPQRGVSFSGLRRDVTIGDVIAALGPRIPSADAAPRRLRQAFVLVADSEAPATPDRVATLSRIRERFGPWYAAATQGRGSVDSTLP